MKYQVIDKTIFHIWPQLFDDLKVAKEYVKAGELMGHEVVILEVKEKEAA